MEITDEQLELLEAIVDAYWTRVSTSTGQKIDFTVSTPGGGVGTFIEHPGLEPSRLSVDFGDLSELAHKGLIRLEGSRPKSGAMLPTAEGKAVVGEQRRVAAVIRADAAISGGDGSSAIDWEAVFPILKAVVDLYGEAEAGHDVSQMEVNQRLKRDDSDLSTSRAFEVLQRDNYLEGRMSVDQVPGPLTVAPTGRALQLLAGWPADGAVAFERLVASLESRIAESSNDEEKGKLRAVLGALQEIGQDLAASVLAKVIMGG
ncbi:MAG TPA: hypothetical protein VGI73_14190 [Solirubrobacterales bacterium]|jgi:hypothetical protein